MLHRLKCDCASVWLNDGLPTWRMSGSFQAPGPAYRHSWASASSASTTRHHDPFASCPILQVWPYAAAHFHGLRVPVVLTDTTIRRPDFAAARAIARYAVCCPVLGGCEHQS